MKVWVCERQVAYDIIATLGLATTADLAKAIAVRSTDKSIRWHEHKDGSFTGVDTWATDYPVYQMEVEGS
jgi:hypothetical protein